MYRYLDAAVLRAPAWPPGRQLPSWPDLTGEDGDASWRPWLERIWTLPGFAVALEQASPALARRLCEIRSGAHVTDSRVRSAVLSTMRYLLRATSRPTPFGRFAGVAAARVATATGPPSVRVGDAHRPAARTAAEWISELTHRLEGERALLRRLPVMANDLVFERDGRLVLDHRASFRTGGAPQEVSVRATGPARAALRLARDPLPGADLIERLSALSPATDVSTIEALVAELVSQRFLLTSLRPPMTVCDPLRHLLEELEAVNAGELGEVAEAAKGLRAVTDELAQHYPMPPQATGTGASRGRAAATMMATLCPAERPPLAVDLLLDAEVTIPAAVAAEAAAAASALVRLARRPAISAGWLSWHARFLDRYGPRALVPLREAVDSDAGLGYPAGYDALPDSREPDGQAAFTDRDRTLLVLAHQAALRRQREVVIDDDLIAALGIGGGVDAGVRVQPSAEVSVRIDAPSLQALACGEFTLAVVGTSRAAGTLTGRFMDLFDDEHRARLTAAYADLPTGTRGALAVQVSAPAPYISTDNVARTPRLLPHVLPVGDHPAADAGSSDGGGTHLLRLQDIAITADLHGLYLVWLPRRRIIEPRTFNAVNPARHTHPLARFLMEAPQALRAPCTGFDWGAAATLPYVPALRYGRTVISPARWRLLTADLPGPSTGWEQWDAALTRWRQEVGLPPEVYLGGGDQRLRLDLKVQAHRALLRDQLARTGNAIMTPAPALGAAGWIGCLPHEITISLATTTQPSAPPPLGGAPLTRSHGHLPGGEWLSVKVYGHPDRQSAILTRHLPRLLGRLGDGTSCWFLRYHDPDHHLRIRLRPPAQDPCRMNASASGVVSVAEVHAWCEELWQAGLTSRVCHDTYLPQTGRFGGATAYRAAETVFAADSAAAIAQLAAVADRTAQRAVTGASLLDIAIAFLGDTHEGMRWLISHARTDPAAPDRDLYQQAIALADPRDRSALTALPYGDQLIDAWRQRAHALAAYRQALESGGELTATVVLPDLLHLHHARVAGATAAGERACLHLARAAALSWTARRRPA
ncbi:lantibiotic dehydratase [Spongiactinospora rosea]|uniref:Lantibiotic dehydratase n=1 Tax=Spongiactinospora rosea TaxID=2248750 RepID=A0A366LUT1_9ACTN|nr:lantibiotic dehydratase [Spongiactinospora rosea]RBQ16942.1 lantibiotic dehydratase [Spongiactinospora rosea]